MAKHLSSYIPEGNLNVYKALYNRISAINLKQYTNKHARNTMASIERQLEGIFKNADTIKRVMIFIWKEYHLDNSKNFAATIAEMFLKRKIGEARDILICCLMHDCKIYSNRYRWKSIIDYLHEIGIISIDDNESDVSIDVIKKRFERLSNEVFQEWLTIYSVFCSQEKPLIPIELAEHYNEKGFLHTLNDNPFTIPPSMNPFNLKNRDMNTQNF